MNILSTLLFLTPQKRPLPLKSPSFNKSVLGTLLSYKIFNILSTFLLKF